MVAQKTTTIVGDIYYIDDISVYADHTWINKYYLVIDHTFHNGYSIVDTYAPNF